MVTLRQLRYLEALAETLHFGQAAEACAVTQPALSMQIKELEDELQVSLIERRKSGIDLTEQGEEIVRRGRTILASVRDLLDYAKHRERVLTGALKLGAIPSNGGGKRGASAWRHPPSAFRGARAQTRNRACLAQDVSAQG